MHRSVPSSKRPAKIRAPIRIRASAALLLVASLLGASAPTHLTTALADEPIAFANGVLDVFDQGDVKQLAEAFHYPPSYSPELLAQDKRMVALSLGVVRSQLGTTSGSGIPFDGSNVISVSVASGNPIFWRGLRANGVFAQVNLLVEFANAGPGFVKLSLFQNGTSWSLHELYFGFAIDDPDAQDHLERIGDELGRVIASETDRQGR